jgi:DNA-binding transcriptional ArsR family regulator
MPRDISGFDPAQDIRLDATTLRALAHPLRVRLLGRLRMYGPATATQLARGLGESSGATSYHLRELAKHGLVAEDDERNQAANHGRERWWRAVHRSTYFDMTLDADTKATGGEYLRAVARAYTERLLHFADNVEYADEAHGRDWADAFMLSDWHLRLTVEQAQRLHHEINVLLDTYRDLPVQPDAKLVVLQVQLLPADDDTAEPKA